MKAFLIWQRLPVASIRIINPARETRVALLFAIAYIGASVATGLFERAWPLPIWGATHLTSDATYAFAFKIGLLFVVPLIAIRRAGYTLEDLLLGWRATPRSILTLALVLVLGILINASKIAPILEAIRSMPTLEAALRVAIGSVLMLFCAGLPEEIVYRWGLQTRLELAWGRPTAIIVTAILFTAWHLPTRFFLASGAEGTANDLSSVLLGTGLPVLVVGLIFGWAWDRWRNLPALIAIHWGIDTLPSVASLLHVPVGSH
ncbi:MAG: CPBP family intramembrane metalloprotease [Planctomycetes bacterium]|nr:CPBP family intramembrane metalloprotease [Planctomycetota bacterium]